MSLSLKQARRMVSKGRRRIWQLARRSQGVPMLRHWHGLHLEERPNDSAVLLAVELRNRGVPGAGELGRELQRRIARVVYLENERYGHMATWH